MRIGRGLQALLVVFTLAGIAVLAGCKVPTSEDADNQSLAGTWYEYFTCDATAVNLLSIWVFNDDGTLSIQDNSNKTTGTWALSGSTLSATLSTQTVLDSSDCSAKTGSYSYSVTVTKDELVLSAGGDSIHLYRDASTARDHLN